MVLFSIATLIGVLYWLFAENGRETREVRNLVLSCPIILFLFMYLSDPGPPTLEELNAEKAMVLGRLHGRQLATKFDVRDGEFIDDRSGVRFDTSLPPDTVNALTRAAMAATENGCERDKLRGSGYQLFFRSGLRAGLRQRLESAAEEAQKSHR